VPSPSVAPSVPPVTAPTTIDHDLGVQLQGVVDASRVRIPSPGLSVAVRLSSGETWTGVSGFASLQPDEPVTNETPFAVASITKTFVTALILGLVDEGVLSLDDPLSDFLPDFPRARRITLRHLLEHTSGVFNFFESPRYVQEVFGDRARRWTFDEILGFVATPYCTPGTCFHYSNTNFVLLGRVTELAMEMSLHEALRQRLLDPLGLENTIFQPDELPPRDAAHGHLGYSGGFFDQTGRSRVIPHMSASTVVWAAGAMVSTPTDLSRWADALYGGEVLSADLTAQMMAYRLDDEYGLGMRTRVFEGRRAVGHLGGIRGFENAMWYFPDSDVTIVVSANRGIFNTDRTMRLLVRALFGS
jgi:D-alanyl-D-alanine carboxypeptidase